MANRGSIAIGEWYHCYSRGVDKRVVFETPVDYDRFLVHMYVGNGTKNIRVSDFSDTRVISILADETLDRDEPLIEIGAYSLMPTHAHFIIREIREGGIAAFMQKIFTGYTMYFNNKYQRTGALFSGTFKSKHIDSDTYLKQVVPYVLINAAELFEPSWKEGIGSIDNLERLLQEYPYSSLSDFMGTKRLENKIINASIHQYYDHIPSLREMLRIAQEYYLDHPPQV